MVLAADQCARLHGCERKLLYVQSEHVQPGVGAQPFEFRAGDVVLLPCSVLHCLSSACDDSAVVYSWQFGIAENKVSPVVTLARASAAQFSSGPQNDRTCGPKIWRAADDNCRGTVQETVRFLVAAHETANHFCVREVRTPPLSGPPLQVYKQQNEVFFVCSGHYEVCLDDARLIVETGDVLWVPCGVPHSYCVVSSAPGILIIVSTHDAVDA
jgi:mannose-6-phosphate isomerase-like protein (cupin superfamily)